MQLSQWAKLESFSFSFPGVSISHSFLMTGQQSHLSFHSALKGMRIPSFVYYFACLFVHLFIRLFVCSFVRYYYLQSWCSLNCWKANFSADQQNVRKLIKQIYDFLGKKSMNFNLNYFYVVRLIVFSLVKLKS